MLGRKLHDETITIVLNVPLDNLRSCIFMDNLEPLLWQAYCNLRSSVFEGEEMIASGLNRQFYSCLFSDLPLNGNEVAGDLTLRKTSPFLLCK